jgi:hypothetical protein
VVLQIISEDFCPNKIREHKFENTPFTFEDETFRNVRSGKGRNGHLGSFRDITYADVTKIGSIVRDVS